jgi:uncharacterized glyoxalase superfamily protein PhnB
VTNDAFDVLLAPTDPISPSSRFADDLRRQLVDALAETPAAIPVRPQEAQMSTITPYLIVRNATAMLDFYRDAFGAVVSESLVDDNGRVGHAELTIGTSRLQLADEFPEFDILGPQSRGGTTSSFTLEVDDVDAAFAKAVGLGATVRTEPADQFHGNRTANILDPAGQAWMLLTKIEDLSPEEYAARAAGAGGYKVNTGQRQAAEESDSPHDHQRKRHGVGDLYYFNIPVPDAAKAERFYSAVLGWQIHDGHIANISAPPGSIGTYYPADSGVRMWFVVEDIHAAVAKVRELGGTAEEPSESPSGWSSECRDDQGTLFCLSVPSAAYSG